MLDYPREICETRAGCCAQGAAISRRKLESGKGQQNPRGEKRRKAAERRMIRLFVLFWRGGRTESLLLGEEGRNAISIGTT